MYTTIRNASILSAAQIEAAKYAISHDPLRFKAFTNALWNSCSFLKARTVGNA